MEKEKKLMLYGIFLNPVEMLNNYPSLRFKSNKKILRLPWGLPFGQNIQQEVTTLKEIKNVYSNLYDEKIVNMEYINYSKLF